MLEETLRYLGIAFASSAILIILSKIILQHIIRRPADYYDVAELYQEEQMLNAAGFSIEDEIETNPEGELTEEHIHVEPAIPRPDEPVKETEPSAVWPKKEESETVIQPVSETVPETAAEDIPEAQTDISAPPSEAQSEISDTEPELHIDSKKGKDSFEEIRRQLEKAYRESHTEESVPAEEAAEKEMAEPEEKAPTEEKAAETDKPHKTENKSKSGRSRRRRKSSRKKKPDIISEAEKSDEIMPSKDMAEAEEKESAEKTEKPEKTEKNRRNRRSSKSGKTGKREKDPKEENKKPAEKSENRSEMSGDQDQGKAKSGSSRKRSRGGRRNKPSMNMRRDELVSIAQSMGLTVPEEATKRMILDSIYEKKRSQDFRRKNADKNIEE